MQKYLLASIRIANDITCYLYPQFEYDTDGTIRPIENKREEYPDRGTIYLPKKETENLSEYSNRLLKVFFDSDNIATNYDENDWFSTNKCKYVVKTSDIEPLARDELIEIIDVEDRTIDNLLRDKQSRIISLNELPLNNKVLIKIDNVIYGPFEFVQEESTTKVRIRIVPDDYIDSYSVTDLERYINVAQVTPNHSDPRKRFINNISILRDKVRITERIEFIDDEMLIKECQKVIVEGKMFDNVDQNALDVLRDVKKILEEHPEIQQKHPILTEKKIERISEMVSNVTSLVDFKDKIIEEYFRQGRISDEEKLLYLEEHPEILEDVISKTADYKNKILDLQMEYTQEQEHINTLRVEKNAVECELEALKQDANQYKETIIRNAQTELEEITKDIEEKQHRKKSLDTEIGLAKETRKKLLRESNELNVDIENKILDWLATKRDNEIISLLVSEFGKYKEPEVEKKIEYNIEKYENGDAIIDKVKKSFEKAGREVGRDEIINYLVTISGNLITVFAGQPGTGKTSTCNLLAKAMGVYDNRYARISVGRGWTSSRDLIGYYNPLTQTFEATQPQFTRCLETMTREAQGVEDDIPYFVLLDEANLSQIEHYWADFIQISDKHAGATLLVNNSKKYQLTDELRFLATINYDHTTEVLSPRFLDRAWIVRMDYEGGFELLNDSIEEISVFNEDSVISYSDLTRFFSVKGEIFAERKLSPYCKEILSTLLEQFSKNGHAISPRSVLAMKRYCIVAEAYMNDRQNAVDYAIAQKVLPQINGSGKVYLEFLESIAVTCKNLNRSSQIISKIIEVGKKEHNYFNFFNI